MKKPLSFALWLVVPVKPFGEGKSRLAAALSPDLRGELSQRWLTHVLMTATAWGHFAGVAVVSRDPAVLTLANTLGALSIIETGDDLNEALTQACVVVLEAGAEGVLILPSDLPLLTPKDLDELFLLAQLAQLAQIEASMIIAPSHDGGTNALLLRPPDAIPYAFGDGSFARHIALAAAAGLPSQIYYSPTLALDVDYPQDLLMTNG